MEAAGSPFALEERWIWTIQVTFTSQRRLYNYRLTHMYSCFRQLRLPISDRFPALRSQRRSHERIKSRAFFVSICAGRSPLSWRCLLKWCHLMSCDVSRVLFVSNKFRCSSQRLIYIYSHGGLVEGEAIFHDRNLYCCYCGLAIVVWIDKNKWLTMIH